MAERPRLNDHLGPFRRFRKASPGLQTGEDLTSADAGESWGGRAAQARRFIRTPRGMITAGTTAAVLLASSGLGIAAAVGAFGPDAPKPTGISQQDRNRTHERHDNLFAKMLTADLAKLHVERGAQLITANSQVEQVSQNVIQDLMSTTIGNLSVRGGGTAAEHIDALQRADIHGIKDHFSATVSDLGVVANLNFAGGDPFGDTTFTVDQMYNPIENGMFLKTTTISFVVDGDNNILVRPARDKSVAKRASFLDGSQALTDLAQKLKLTGLGTPGSIPDFSGQPTPSTDFVQDDFRYQIGNDGFIVVTETNKVPQSQMPNSNILGEPVSIQGVTAAIANAINAQGGGVAPELFDDPSLPDSSDLAQLNKTAGTLEGALGLLGRLYAAAN